MSGMTRAAVTNHKVAEDLGVSHAHISRIRSGDRHPSLDLMARIRVPLAWSMDEQSEALTKGEYAAEFERHLRVHYGE